MRKLILFFFCTFFLIACGGEQSATQKLEDAKWTAVMANHDVVMPMMGTTNKVRKNLKKILSKKENLSPEKREKIDKLIKDLNQADEGMMDWMNGFQQLKKLQADKSHQEIIAYLDTEDAIIKQVGVDMTNSIKRGMDFIEEMERQ